MAKWEMATLGKMVKEKYSYSPHCPKKTKYCPWPVCSGCGLVYLHNNATAWAIQKGCNYYLLDK